MRVLLAIDGSACSEAAARMVAESIHPEGRPCEGRPRRRVDARHALVLSIRAGPMAAENVTDVATAACGTLGGWSRVAARLKFKGFRTSVLTPDAGIPARNCRGLRARLASGPHRSGIARATRLQSAAPRECGRSRELRHRHARLRIVRIPVADALHVPQESRHAVHT